MSGHMTIEGVEYISSKRASEISGYSQDYIGQLARSGKISGRRVGGLWYIVSDSLTRHKEVADAYTPVPPTFEQQKTSDDSSLITFEGRTYVSAARAAKQTSYHQDYVGQLARSGKIMSHQVGRRWYVDIEALKSHKKEKDALLGAVQALSVGIQKGEVPVKDPDIVPAGDDSLDVGLHYTYKTEPRPLIPVIEVKSEAHVAEENRATFEKEKLIPIRVIKTADKPEQRQTILKEKKGKNGGRLPVLSIFYRIYPVVAIGILALLIYNFSPPTISIRNIKVPLGIQGSGLISSPIIETATNFARNLFLKEIRYSRE